MGASFEGGEKLSSAYDGMFFISVIFACHCLYARRLQNNVRFGNKKTPLLRCVFVGGNNRARTCDPLLVRQMLSQLSYAPKW